MYSSSSAAFSASLAAKKTSWAARKRAQRASSSLREARGARFHWVIRSLYFWDTVRKSVDPDSDSASATIFSLIRLPSELCLSSSAKKSLRLRSKVFRACENRPHSS